ncbi:tryptophan halogenase family protein [Asticcacaulis sp.]|uniref:tryptophan halogenase family protein n=1 Tax=Asticcacaulis sp. TaxID=1872648 RepID=UPI002CDECA23|nr:tryptophan halogenase family protein [Asticcacaulis sp.]HTM81102.1 tryptophan halogenase family protein [Asticcacaulis sp.]
MAEPIRKIIIAGGGTAGWMSAAALKAGLGQTVDILLIESEDIATVGVGEATIPTMRVFNEHIGVNEAEFIRATEATFKLGVEFRNWGHTGNRYFHPFGDYGATHEGLAAHQIWRRLKAEGDDTPLEAYSLATQMAYAGKFFPPNPDPRSPMHDYSYAFHFDASLYAKFLRGHCEARGVKRRNAKITGVNQRSADGHIESLALDDGSVEMADFFVDCTGFRGLLIEGALKAGYTDWSDYLPVDRAWAVPTAKSADLSPYTRSTAHTAGWQWRVPLQHRTGNGHVYSSRFMDDETARTVLLDHLDAQPLKDPMLIRFTTGHRNTFWDKNCICVGLSSGFLEPLESTSINFIQLGIIRLLELFPSREIDPFLRQEYNTRTLDAYEKVRDFIILHYCTNTRDEALWRYCADMPLPDDLAYKMELYRRRGEVILRKYDHFAEPSWVSIYNGQGVIPDTYDPLANRIPLETLRTLMQTRRDGIQRVVAQLPSHAQFIAQHCPSDNFMKTVV